MVALFVSFVLGAVVGRWWFALVLGCGVGLWIALSTDVDEVPAWLLGGGYGVLAVAGATLGVLVRSGRQRHA